MHFLDTFCIRILTLTLTLGLTLTLVLATPYKFYLFSGFFW